MQPYFYVDNSDSLRSTAVLRVFKAIQSYTERKKDMMSPEIELRISRTEGRAFYQLLITATYLFFLYSGAKMWNALRQNFIHFTSVYLFKLMVEHV